MVMTMKMKALSCLRERKHRPTFAHCFQLVSDCYSSVFRSIDRFVVRFCRKQGNWAKNRNKKQSKDFTAIETVKDKPVLIVFILGAVT